MASDESRKRQLEGEEIKRVSPDSNLMKEEKDVEGK